MKTLNLLSIIFLFIFLSCNSEVKTIEKKVNFGIFETVKASEIPDYVLDSIKVRNVQLENNTQLAVIGYILKSDSSVLQLDFSKENFKLVKTFYTVDTDKEYYAIVAIKPSPVINNSDIKKTKAKGNRVDIYFNLNGAGKWANMTKNNIGNTVVFIIDNQIYTMSEIGGEIRNGVAIINGIENEAIAKEISESLNASLSE